MSLQKPNPNSVLPAAGARQIRTSFRADGTSKSTYTAQSTDGQNHEVEFEGSAALAWISNCISNPGTSAAIDALVAAYPSFTAADLAPAVAALRIYGDHALGFTEQ